MTHPSYWFKQALEIENPQPAVALADDLETDVLIVGGGFTGMWTAIMLKEQAPEKRITIIDKGLCGSGASGSNGGCMLTWSTKYPTLKRLFGEQHATWLVQESERVVLEIDEFCRRYAIDAQLSLKGVYYTATNSAQVGGMKPVVDELTRLGVNSWRKCSEDELQENTGSSTHLEGYHSPVAASVQPALLARGLRRVAIDMGIEIYENTPMVQLEYGQIATIRTPQATIKAKQVVLALNAWMVEQFKQFRTASLWSPLIWSSRNRWVMSYLKVDGEQVPAFWILVFLFIIIEIHRMAV